MNNFFNWKKYQVTLWLITPPPRPLECHVLIEWALTSKNVALVKRKLFRWFILFLI